MKLNINESNYPEQLSRLLTNYLRKFQLPDEVFSSIAEPAEYFQNSYNGGNYEKGLTHANTGSKIFSIHFDEAPGSIHSGNFDVNEHCFDFFFSLEDGDRNFNQLSVTVGWNQLSLTLATLIMAEWFSEDLPVNMVGKKFNYFKTIK